MTPTPVRLVSEHVMIQPDDWHVHLRDGDLLATVAPLTARFFSRAVAMPNLATPIETPAQALAYRRRILSHTRQTPGFIPLIPCYLTDQTPVDDLIGGLQSGAFFSAKLYPARATTHSTSGVADLKGLDRLLEPMNDIGATLMVHAETTQPGIDVFDRERVFVEQWLHPWSQRYPKLRLVMEHITTAAGVQFVQQSHDRVGGTITPHHLLFTRTDLLTPQLNPFLFCYPVLKTSADRDALRRAVASGHPRLMAGTDSAPHTLQHKQREGKPGVFNTPVALSWYAEIFDQLGARDRLESFLSRNGALFHELPIQTSHLTLQEISPPQPAVNVIRLLNTPQLSTEANEVSRLLQVATQPIMSRWRIKHTTDPQTHDPSPIAPTA